MWKNYTKYLTIRGRRRARASCSKVDGTRQCRIHRINCKLLWVALWQPATRLLKGREASSLSDLAKVQPQNSLG